MRSVSAGLVQPSASPRGIRAVRIAAEFRCIRGQKLVCRLWPGLSNRFRIDVIIPIISCRLNKTIIAQPLAILIYFRITLR
ncbi:hypothetical protein C1X73_28150 [Pseudomonas sp. FW305-130]|nr:hypothetical protein C1X74_09480 [Pseudomonas sp. GW460-5]PNB54137.1 hypothetical protein C1X73_28150 [Pseudomonas sp. FW305-130]